MSIPVDRFALIVACADLCTGIIVTGRHYLQSVVVLRYLRSLTLPRPMLDDAERIDYFEVVAQYEFDAIEPFPPWHTKSKKGDAP